MPGPDPLSLEQRVARLERLVARLLEQDQPGKGDRRPDAGPAFAASDAPPAPGTADPGPTGATNDPSGRFSWASGPKAPGATGREASGTEGPGTLADHGERWLGRVGIGFLILAFAFLFRYALDQGWIVPVARLVLGLVAATALVGIGLRLEGIRERYSQYLLGGAIGIYYLVGYAAYERYALVPFALAFAFMCAVTVLAFVLAERQRLASLAVIGAGGGLLTPFIVNTGVANVPGLVVYTTLLLAGAGAIQFLRGWRLLLFVLGLGGLAVMGLAVSEAVGLSDFIEAAITLVGVLAAWALFGALPLFRARLHDEDAETWPDPPLPEWLGQVAPPATIAKALLRIACIASASIAVLELGALFEVEQEGLGVLFALAFLVYVVLARGLLATRVALDPAAETASLLLVLAIFVFFLDYRVVLPLAVVATAMHMADSRWRLRGVALLAHVVFAQLLILVIGRVGGVGLAGASPFGVREMAALGAIGLGFTTAFTFESAAAKGAYRIGAHVAFMAWLATQFGPMQRGQELTSLSWGVYGAALLLISLRNRDRKVQQVGLATLGVVAAKLLVVDMAQVDVIWRILLFMGFGVAFLGLSYLINRQVDSD